jgi:hypothetical protein
LKFLVFSVEDQFVENPQTPKPYTPLDLHIQCFSDLHPIEVARQLTLYEWKMFIKIEPPELRSGNWGKPNKLELAPNVVTQTTWFNKVSFSLSACFYR